MNVPGLEVVTPPCPNPDCFEGRVVTFRSGAGIGCGVCNCTGFGPSRLEWRCPTCDGVGHVPPCAGDATSDDICCPDPNHHLHGCVVAIVPIALIEAAEKIVHQRPGVNVDDIYALQAALRTVAEWTPSEGEA